MSTASFTSGNSGTGAPLLSGTAAGRVDTGGSVAPPVFSAAGTVGNGGTAVWALLAGAAHARAQVAAPFPRAGKQTPLARTTFPAPFPRDVWKDEPHA